MELKANTGEIKLLYGVPYIVASRHAITKKYHLGTQLITARDYLLLTRSRIPS